MNATLRFLQIDLYIDRLDSQTKLHEKDWDSKHGPTHPLIQPTDVYLWMSMCRWQHSRRSLAWCPPQHPYWRKRRLVRTRGWADDFRDVSGVCGTSKLRTTHATVYGCVSSQLLWLIFLSTSDHQRARILAQITGTYRWEIMGTSSLTELDETILPRPHELWMSHIVR